MLRRVADGKTTKGVRDHAVASIVAFGFRDRIFREMETRRVDRRVVEVVEGTKVTRVRRVR